MDVTIDWFQTLSGLLGGLALFIFGMNMMSEGLQKSAGEKMKSILEFLTKNPFMGMCAGALVTAVLQSSAATTVMVIGFVSAGLMNLPQAISVVIGANIGTTITGQIVAFDINTLIWPIIVAGFLMFFFGKKELPKNIGETIFAFGLLFLGIKQMSDVMKPLANVPQVTEMIGKVASNSPLGLITGFLMTVVIQSSSAVVAIVQNFAKQASETDPTLSIIGLEGAIPFILGSNIGATIPSLLAGIGKSKDAQRTAISHTVFNLTGAAVFIFLVKPYAALIRLIPPVGPVDSVGLIARQIANSHTYFNIICMIVWLPLYRVMEKIVVFLIPGEENQIDDSKPRFLDEKLYDQPVFAMHLCISELSRMADFADQMIDHSRIAVNTLNSEEIDAVNRLEKVVDSLHYATIRYITNLTANNSLTEVQSLQLAGLMHVTNDVEHVGDRCKDIIKTVEEMIKKEYTFSDEALEEIEGSFDIVKKMLSDAMESLRKSDKALANTVLVDEDKIDDLETQLRKRHMKRIKKKKCSPSMSVVYTEILHNIERIGDHCKNIAEAVIGDSE